jgi:hypothetical protein
MRATYTTHLILLDLITLIIFETAGLPPCDELITRPRKAAERSRILTIRRPRPDFGLLRAIDRIIFEEENRL